MALPLDFKIFVSPLATDFGYALAHRNIMSFVCWETKDLIESGRDYKAASPNKLFWLKTTSAGIDYMGREVKANRSFAYMVCDPKGVIIKSPLSFPKLLGKVYRLTMNDKKLVAQLYYTSIGRKQR